MATMLKEATEMGETVTEQPDTTGATDA
jgi:hypothetical protein